MLWDPLPDSLGPLVPAWWPHRPLELPCFPVRHLPPDSSLVGILSWFLVQAAPPLQSAITQCHLLRGVLPGHPEQPLPSTSIICLGREVDRTSTHSFLFCLSVSSFLGLSVPRVCLSCSLRVPNSVVGSSHPSKDIERWVCVLTPESTGFTTHRKSSRVKCLPRRKVSEA